MRRFVAVLAMMASCALVPGAVAQTAGSGGAVAFRNSGNPAAQASFLRGLALLHNFEYPRAAAAFREAQAADPGFALAYWGEAMTYNHPVWMEQDAEAGRAALGRLAATPAARAARVRDPRERLYLEAVEALYGEGDKHARDRSYSDAMGRLFAAHPDDVDARSFYALSLLGLAHDGRDYGLYMRAAGLLEEVYPENRDHPGVLHYLIHAYDDPTHAPLGLRMARRYGEVAPDASHAIHMTSHIFLALGMWDEVIRANTDAVAAASALARAAGRPAIVCGHGNEWLVYGLQQAGRMDEARAVIGACGDRAATAPAGPSRQAATVSWADMMVRHFIETGERVQVDGVDLRSPGVDSRTGYVAVLTVRDAESAQRAAAGLAATFATDALSADEPPPLRRRREIIAGQAEAIVHLRSGRTEQGIAALREIAERERAMPADFGPPLVEKPSFELLGDELLRLGRREEAQAAYRSALALAPGRRLSLEGLRRAGG